LINSISDLFKTILKIILILIINIIIIYFNISKLFIILLIVLYSIRHNILIYINNNSHHFYKNKISFTMTILNEILHEMVKMYLKIIKNKKQILLNIITNNSIK